MTLKNKKYLVACSGGPDSLALLDMYKTKYELFVCHINYHQRETANRDENLVKKYCKENNLKFIKYDYQEKAKGNFQDNARVFRYDKFRECVKKYDLSGVLVGHHLDDLLETYLLQQARGNEVSYYGLNRKTNLNGLIVVRPLLKYTKSELENYCLKHQIIYGVDESNLTDHYQRNKIRHNKIEKMTKAEKLELLKEINYKNYQQKEEQKAINSFIKNRTLFNYEEFMSCPYLKRLIRTLTYNDLSDAYLTEIIKALKSKKNVELLVQDKFIYKEYDYIEIADKTSDYYYKLDCLTYKKYLHFTLARKGTSFEGVTVRKDDFPLTIRNVRAGDAIKMRYGTKKLNRFFIDKKIRTSLRKTWPIMLNKDGIAILVPEIGCNVSHYSSKHNLYMIK